MRLRLGARWKCTNPECGAEIIVALAAKIEGSANPRCCCGSVMKRPYRRPTLTKITEAAEIDGIRRHLESSNE
jgi:hypothetical protein